MTADRRLDIEQLRRDVERRRAAGTTAIPRPTYRERPGRLRFPRPYDGRITDDPKARAAGEREE